MSFRRLRLFCIASAALLAITPSLGQPPARYFEVTSVRENHSGLDRDVGINISGSRISGTNLSLRTLIIQAYGLLDFQITGGPNWLSTARFDIQATTNDPEPITAQELGPMLQHLLADRFHLVVRHESRPMKAYVLVVAKQGSKLHEAAGTPENSMSGVNQRGTSGTAKMIGSGVPMSALAYRIAEQTPFRGDMVIDKTGLTGFYDFTLEWEVGENAGSSLITSLQEQLGLRLLSEKTPVDVLVVDHVEKPSLN